MALLVSLTIGQNEDDGVSDFTSSRQSLKKVSWHNSRTSHEININLNQ